MAGFNMELRNTFLFLSSILLSFDSIDTPKSLDKNANKTITITSKTLGDVALGQVKAKELPRAIKAFLDTIAAAEGTVITNHHCSRDAGYRSIVGCNLSAENLFTDYETHPNISKFVGKNLRSDAAGRYQILSSTWNWVAPKIGVSDFYPETQDRIAQWLINYRGAMKFIERIGQNNYSSFKKAIYQLNNEWASLPGSPYGQRTRKMQALWQVYQESYRVYGLR